ncbi:putative hydrolase [Corynebacterium suranareeae]|uniref:Putative hydrolase n=1 Tax=Corynebacterium suranareeae TaxID=2506452 RepID=A0A160PPD7_9CORY|nr:carbon-nitrogen hydrolase family protein [Corynebacterium suranareeae]BAU94471.1 putative hydrolase [Corynebacterium suranareeae]
MKIALAQINTDDNVEQNLEKVAGFVERSSISGARLVVFPEATMTALGTNLVSACKNYGSSWRASVASLAKQFGITIVIGEFEEAADGRVRNLAGIYFPDGTRSEYAKIHLFDAFGNKESDEVEPGTTPTVVEVDGVKVGVAICYDIRFPKLFAELSRSGAEVIVAPTSWGAGPGKIEQWETLARSRALDSNSFVVALGQADPAVTGVKAAASSPTGIGHSLVSDPFGHAVIELGKEESLEIVELDLELVQRAQQTIPILENARLGY